MADLDKQILDNLSARIALLDATLRRLGIGLLIEDALARARYVAQIFDEYNERSDVIGINEVQSDDKEHF